MVFYNGFNLLVDIVICFVVFKVAFSMGADSGYQQRIDEE